MQVSRWGNSLAIRLPKAVVEMLGLREGDDIDVRVADPRVFEVARQKAREEHLNTLREMRGTIPADFIFDREDAHARR